MVVAYMVVIIMAFIGCGGESAKTSTTSLHGGDIKKILGKWQSHILVAGCDKQAVNVVSLSNSFYSIEYGIGCGETNTEIGLYGASGNAIIFYPLVIETGEYDASGNEIILYPPVGTQHIYYWEWNLQYGIVNGSTEIVGEVLWLQPAEWSAGEMFFCNRSK